MKVDAYFVYTTFDRFNSEIFGGELPLVPIKASTARGYLGRMAWEVKRGPLGREKPTNFRMLINCTRDLPQNVWEDTIIHEMIHYYIAWKGIKDTSSHGKVFRQMMEKINREHGRNVTISHRQTPEEQQTASEGQPMSPPLVQGRWHVVAIVYMKNGRKGLKVLPRVITSISYYVRNVMHYADTDHVELYLHNSPWLERFPVSKALRVYYPDENELETNMKGAEVFDLKKYGCSI